MAGGLAGAAGIALAANPAEAGPVVPMTLSYPGNVGLNQNFTLTVSRNGGGTGAISGSLVAFGGSFTNLPSTWSLDACQNSRDYTGIQLASAICNDADGDYAGIVGTMSGYQERISHVHV